MVPSGGTRDDEPIAELLTRLRPEIERTLAIYALSDLVAEEILHEILFMLIYRWDRIGNRDLWLLTTLRRSCVRRAEECAREQPQA